MALLPLRCAGCCCAGGSNSPKPRHGRLYTNIHKRHQSFSFSVLPSQAKDTSGEWQKQKLRQHRLSHRFISGLSLGSFQPLLPSAALLLLFHAVMCCSNREGSWPGIVFISAPSSPDCHTDRPPARGVLGGTMFSLFHRRDPTRCGGMTWHKGGMNRNHGNRLLSFCYDF